MLTTSTLSPMILGTSVREALVSHFKDEGTEGLRASRNCPGSHSQEVKEWCLHLPLSHPASVPTSSGNGIARDSPGRLAAEPAPTALNRCLLPWSKPWVQLQREQQNREDLQGSTVSAPRWRRPYFVIYSLKHGEFGISGKILSLKKIFYWLYYYTCPNFFLPFISLRPVLPLTPPFPHLSLCSWVIPVSSLASPFPILFLTSPCLFYTYQLCFLFPVPFPWFSPFPLPTGNPPCDLHFCDSGPVLVVCLAFVFVF